MTPGNTSSTSIADVVDAVNRARADCATPIAVRLDLSRAAYEALRHRAQCDRDDASPFLRVDGLPWRVDDTLPDMAIVWRYSDGTAKPMILAKKGGA